MKRTTLFLDERMEAELRSLARRRKRPLAAEVREALARYVAEESSATKPALGFMAIGGSGRPDTAERHEDILRRAWGSRPPKRPARRKR